jgi:hypothetical protein
LFLFVVFFARNERLERSSDVTQHVGDEHGAFFVAARMHLAARLPQVGEKEEQDFTQANDAHDVTTTHAVDITGVFKVGLVEHVGDWLEKRHGVIILTILLIYFFGK